MVIGLCAVLALQSCKKDYGDLISPTVEQFLGNATQSQLNNLVSGAQSGMRTNIALYLDDVGSVGREIYRFSASEPRYVTDLLGANGAPLTNSDFYITNPWASRYQVVKNCNVLIQAATDSKLITDAERAGYTGFARMAKAYQLLLNLNLTDSNGIRIDVSNPDALGPIVGYNDALTAISSLLDSAQTDLSTASIVFPLAGFDGFADGPGLIKVDRAIAARVDVYRGLWDNALSDLGASFFGLSQDFNLGVNHVFSTGSGDQINPAFIPQNQNGEVRVAHPSYATDIETGDDRIGKATLRTATASLQELSSNRDVWVYTSGTADIPMIRNEELILIYAEAKIQKGVFPDAVTALNTIRTGHNLPVYSGIADLPHLITEMLNQKRYSLFYEGHRWIDMRRYGLLGQLPIDRPGDVVWTEFPLPVSEQQ
jgi:hypothetical protein